VDDRRSSGEDADADARTGELRRLVRHEGHVGGVVDADDPHPKPLFLDARKDLAEDFRVRYVDDGLRERRSEGGCHGYDDFSRIGSPCGLALLGEHDSGNFGLGSGGRSRGAVHDLGEHFSDDLLDQFLAELHG